MNWALVLPQVNLGLVLFWQIFGGFAVVSGAVFGASFFTKTQAASVAIFIISILLAVAAAVQTESMSFDLVPQIAAQSFLFPPMAWVFFLSFMLNAQYIKQDVDMTAPLPGGVTNIWDEGVDEKYAGTAFWTRQTAPVMIFIFLILQIFAFAALAAVSETLIHGKRRRQRDFDATSSEDHVAVRTTGLVKHYGPTWWTKMFCWFSRRPHVKAVDGLDLVSHRNQVLCLLGPNGSGKTTTLDMLAGAQKPTSGSIQINSLPTQLGMPPSHCLL